jgi:hypothetical protein
VVAATNRDLARMVEERRFRTTSTIAERLPHPLPPLRERPEDIPALIRFFVQRLARPMNRHVEVIPNETLEALRRYAWPGNVRELANLIERAMILSKGRTLDVPLAELRARRARGDDEGARRTLEAVERVHILRILNETNWRLGGPRGRRDAARNEADDAAVVVEAARNHATPPQARRRVMSNIDSAGTFGLGDRTVRRIGYWCHAARGARRVRPAKGSWRGTGRPARGGRVGSATTSTRATSMVPT